MVKNQNDITDTSYHHIHMCHSRYIYIHVKVWKSVCVIWRQYTVVEVEGKGGRNTISIMVPLRQLCGFGVGCRRRENVRCDGDDNDCGKNGTHSTGWWWCVRYTTRYGWIYDGIEYSFVNSKVGLCDANGQVFGLALRVKLATAARSVQGSRFGKSRVLRMLTNKGKCML